MKQHGDNVAGLHSATLLEKYRLCSDTVGLLLPCGMSTFTKPPTYLEKMAKL